MGAARRASAPPTYMNTKPAVMDSVPTRSTRPCAKGYRRGEGWVGGGIVLGPHPQPSPGCTWRWRGVTKPQRAPGKAPTTPLAHATSTHTQVILPSSSRTPQDPIPYQRITPGFPASPSAAGGKAGPWATADRPALALSAKGGKSSSANTDSCARKRASPRLPNSCESCSSPMSSCVFVHMCAGDRAAQGVGPHGRRHACSAPITTLWLPPTAANARTLLPNRSSASSSDTGCEASGGGCEAAPGTGASAGSAATVSASMVMSAAGVGTTGAASCAAGPNPGADVEASSLELRTRHEASADPRRR